MPQVFQAAVVGAVSYSHARRLSLVHLEGPIMRQLLVLLLVIIALPVSAESRPNVILIITDDQGYGDIGAHGNDIIQTPNLDRLHSESVRLTDYHVDPTCSPTRAALMTGRYSTRVGVWHTINGRSLLAGEETTLAEVFKANGYRTGMFGKWHLGENYPCRPQDQGFDHVVWHKGGGVGQGPDYLGNDYFDDHYEVNGAWQKFEGYCTDVWFDQAIRYIGEKKDKPFFVYLATNAPHGPWFVDDKYSKPYRDAGLPQGAANFYGMVTNIDENLGRLRAHLEESGLADNTLLIYTTDNGTALGHAQGGGFKFFNANMRGIKSTQYDGGHRVPFFMHWPKGSLVGGRDVDPLCAHIDVLPTLVDVLKLDKPKGRALDGLSLKRAIAGEADGLPERTIVASVQRKFVPDKWDRTVAMNGKWRLVDGKALYDIKKDPGQQNDLAGKRPEVVAMLSQDYDRWWESMRPSLQKVTRYGIGGGENPMTMMSHDWLMEKGGAAWHQNHVRRNALINGPFAVNVVKPGKYRITPMRWPEYVDKPSGCVKVAIDIELHAGDPAVPAAMRHGGECDPAQRLPSYEFDLPAGPAELTTTLTREDGKTFGAYYVKVEYLGE